MKRGKSNAMSQFKRSFTSTQAIPVGFPKQDNIFIFQTVVKESGFPLQKASSKLGQEDVLHQLAWAKSLVKTKHLRIHKANQVKNIIPIDLLFYISHRMIIIDPFIQFCDS